ncbi:hypothetical protein BpHYR1_009898 [Brachionus plicatilis]|uniref:Uncharacterized protein n=1 Tax=Brachionus plicatilis TaxID=10195 RepID=A0A3M7QJL5_BRAPC|nr:hypothetical protein BpHYR1_009898 [Brachionus plicatilis]
MIRIIQTICVYHSSEKSINASLFFLFFKFMIADWFPWVLGQNQHKSHKTRPTKYVIARAIVVPSKAPPITSLPR